MKNNHRINELKEIVRGRIFSDRLNRIAYSVDASIYQIIPQCIVAPKDSADIRTIVKWAAKNHIPIAPRGAASGVAGESLCSGIVLDMTGFMDNILEYDEQSGVVSCQPGVVLDELNDFLAPYGRKIGPDPSSGNRATVGGCVANNATGAHSLVYGYFSEHLVGAEAVLSDGSIVRLENDFTPSHEKNSVDEIAEALIELHRENEETIQKGLPESKRNRSGYAIGSVFHDKKVDLAKLVAGSEGTLAILTRVTLKTVVIPKEKGLLQIEFDTVEKMAKAVPLIVDTGASACELMDKQLMEMAVAALPEYRDVLPADAPVALLVEHCGDTKEQVSEKLKVTQKAVSEFASRWTVYTEADKQKRLWKSRKDAVPLLFRKRGHGRPIPFVEDISVPNTKLAEYVVGLDAIRAKYDIFMSWYGHAGDGELHIRPFLDIGDPAGIKKMKALADEIFSLAWSLGGTISGEHAVGLVRAAYLEKQYGSEYYQLLGSVKKIFDPLGLLNPGKIINSDPDVMTTGLKASKPIRSELISNPLIFANNELESELDQCNGCGLCRSRTADLRMCPVFRAVGSELATSRAKAAVLRGWASGQLDETDFDSADFKNLLSLCTNCKACSTQCPSGVDISKMILAARAKYAAKKGNNPAEMMLSNNRLLSFAGSSFSSIANIVTELGVTKWAMSKTVGMEATRSLPKFAKGGFLKNGRKFLEKVPPLENPVDKVAWFSDTYANFNEHAIGYSALEILTGADIQVILPDQRPVPIPAICYGDIKTARRDLSYILEHLSKAVEDGYKIVCGEPSAAMVLKNELKYLIRSRQAELVSENTFEMMDYIYQLYLAGKIEANGNKVGSRLAYHKPCHLTCDDKETPSLKLLRQLCSADVEDLNAGCCGLAGTYGMQKKNHEISMTISENLAGAIDQIQPDILVTECSACRMQLQHISDLQVVHPIEILRTVLK